MEIYVAYKDYNWMMDFTEQLLEKCAVAVKWNLSKLNFWRNEVNFKAPYMRIVCPCLDAIKDHTGFDLYDKSEDEIREACKRHWVLEVDESRWEKVKLIDEIFGEKCEA